MAKKANTEGLDLSTLSGRLAYAVKSAGPSYVEKNTSLSRSQVNRLSNQLGSTTLECAAEVSMATGFELKWIALGEGPQRVDQEIWEETDKFLKVPQVDDSQTIDFNFSPHLFEKNNANPDNCQAWIVDCPINLKNLKKGYTVLIDTQRKKESGLVAINSSGLVLAGELQFNLDGTARFRSDIESPETDQVLTKEQLDGLEIIGKIIWCGE